MKQDAHQPGPFPLADIAMSMLIKDKQTKEYVFGPRGREDLNAAIDALFSATSDPKQAIDELIKVAAALEHKLESPRAAELILKTLGHHDRALGVLGIAHGKKARKRREAFAQFNDNAIANRAPRFAAAPPPGSIKASSFLEPGREQKRHATAIASASDVAPKPARDPVRRGVQRRSGA